MLTGKMVRVRYARDRIIPCYIETTDSAWLSAAEQVVEIFRGHIGKTRGELEENLREAFGDDPSQLVYQGLIKLLEDRSETEVASGESPEKLREAVFAAAARHRQQQPVGETLHTFDRSAVLEQAAAELALTTEVLEKGLFADLKSEQILSKVPEITSERLLQRYNVALAQAVLLRAVQVQVIVRDESPQRYRQLFRAIKFHRLICETHRLTENALQLQLDGPLSLFSATQRYGLQLALFLPTLLLCEDFELTAQLRWGSERKPKMFQLDARQGLVSHAADTGMYVPPEVGMFVELFRKRVTDWDIVEEAEVYPLGETFWVPDFRLVQKETGRTVLLELLGFWRRQSAERHLEKLRLHAKQPFLLAVSDQLHIDEAQLSDVPAGIYRFRSMPLPEEVARLAEELLRQ